MRRSRLHAAVVLLLVLLPLAAAAGEACVGCLQDDAGAMPAMATSAMPPCHGQAPGAVVRACCCAEDTTAEAEPATLAAPSAPPPMDAAARLPSQPARGALRIAAGAEISPPPRAPLFTLHRALLI